MLRDVWHSLVSITSFLGKELREVFRRPGVLLSLIVGPFLIMAIFGIGYTGHRAPFVTEIVVPEGSELPREPEFYADLAPGRLDVVGVTADRAATEERLRANEIDLMVVAPENAAARLREGEQTEIAVAWNQVDPVYDQLAHLAVASMISELNAEIIRRGAAEGISLTESELGPAVENVSPEVLAKPTTAVTQNVAPTPPSVVNFFAPAVLALVLQHLAVTLTALSMVRERLSGQMDLFRVAPVSSSEVLIGKYLAYALLSLAVTVIVGALMVFGLGVPVLAGYLPALGIVLLLTFASLGVGLLISLVADSERNAVQLSMLVLLASVFFSGFVLPVQDFIGPVQYLAYALPVTHGIQTLQEVMLRGAVSSWWMVGTLFGIGAVLYLLTLLRLRRVLGAAR
ncbi:MAG TPA: ABC transporter permease [candidate division Zixibacteria bacterium]|nr:ABC transporter permease [candidate division Zixibacteria bacterium]